MKRTEELLALAEAATKGPHRLEIPQPLVYLADKNFQRACTPETIKQLVKLAVLQNANMLKIQEHSHGSCVNYAWCKEAIAAFERFEKGGK